MSSNPSKQLKPPSSTTSRDADSAAWIRAETARGKEIAARLQDVEHAEKDSSSSSKESSGTPTTVSSVNVFYYTSPFDKAFLGTVDDSSKLAHYSLIARDQLMHDDVQTSNTSNTNKQLQVTLGRLDRDAGLLILEYINNSDFRHPKPLTYDNLPSNTTLAFRCRVHHACSAFSIPHQLRGQVFRDRLCYEIRHLSTVTFSDFQLVCDTLAHDAGLMYVMQNKVAYHTLRGWISEHDLACIWEYVSKSDAQRGTNYVEKIGAIFEKLQAEATTGGKVYESGWRAMGVAPPAQSSIVGSAVVMPARPSNMTVGAAEKTPVLSIDTAARGQQSVPSMAVVVSTGPRSMAVATAGRAPTSPKATVHSQGDHLPTASIDQSSESEITFIRSSTAGPSLDISSPLKKRPAEFISNARPSAISGPKLTLSTGIRVASTSGDKIDSAATETNTTTPPKKPFGNVGGKIGAIKAAPGLSKGKGKGNEKVAILEKKEQDEKVDGRDKDEVKDSKKDKGKESITSPESSLTTTGSSSTPGKMSWAQMAGSRP